MGIALQRGIPRRLRDCAVVRTEDPEAAVQALRDLGTGRFRRVVEVPLCAGYRLAPRLYAAVRLRLEQEIMRSLAEPAHADRDGQPPGAQHPLQPAPPAAMPRDFSALVHGICPWSSRAQGRPWSDSLPVLARLRASSRSSPWTPRFPRCGATGLAPGYRGGPGSPGSEPPGLHRPCRRTGTILACDLSVHPSAARLFPGRVFFFSSRFAPLRLWERLSDHGLLPCRSPRSAPSGLRRSTRRFG